MVKEFDRLGIDGAIFIPSFSMNGYDASHAVEVQQAHPGRHAALKYKTELDRAEQFEFYSTSCQKQHQ